MDSQQLPYHIVSQLVLYNGPTLRRLLPSRELPLIVIGAIEAVWLVGHYQIILPLDTITPLIHIRLSICPWAVNPPLSANPVLWLMETAVAKYSWKTSREFGIFRKLGFNICSKKYGNIS